MVGHIKTVLVLSFGFLLFGNIVSVKARLGGEGVCLNGCQPALVAEPLE